MKQVGQVRVLAVAILLLICVMTAMGGTTGKLIGKVIDADTGEPVVGANVVVIGTSRGAATDLDGEYYILNLPPGRYDVRASALGFGPLVFEGVRVSVDQSTPLDFELQPTVLEAAEVVTVTARPPDVKKDLTSSEARVDATDLQMQPIDNLGEAVNLQAGVVNGHFRGGRSSEVSYMIDGVIVSDKYSSSDPLGRETSNQVEVAAIQEIQVISGTFNAEYGQAMSGIINVVTKDGDVEEYHGEATVGFGDYVSDQSLQLGEYTPKPDRTTYLDDLNPTHFQDIQFNLSGPVPLIGGNKTSFFGSFRRISDHGRLYGQRLFVPSDSSDFSSDNSENWHIERSGDGEVVTLDPYEKWSMQGKLTHRFTPTLKAFYSLLYDDMEYQNLDGRVNESSEDPRLFKYNPEGNYRRFRSGQNHLLAINNAFSDKSFYNARLSYTHNSYQYYVHEDPYTDEYVNPDRLQDAQNYAYYTGGQGMWHHDRETHRAGVKFDLTSQVTKRHQVKAGIDLSQYLLTLEEFQLVWDDETDRQKINPLGSWNHQVYPSRKASSPLEGFPFKPDGYRPMEFSAYIQDKMEYEFMVVNFGVRFDFFHPDGSVPTDLRDPANERLTYYDSELDTTVTGLDPITPIANPNSTNPYIRYNFWRDKYRNASSVKQVSPRIGIAFPVTARGVLHFSYGHFFQIPPFQYLYENPEYAIRTNTMSLIGNAELKPERTVMYEVGLQQQLVEGVAMTVTGFYKDVRNLLGTEILRTYNQIQYARYINRDYANVRGVTVAIDKRFENKVGVAVDYTFQIAEGNASDPLQVYQYNQADPPKEPEKKVRPLDWDQTHTLNGTFTFGDPSDWSVALIGRLGSGLPYTSNPFLQPQGDLNGARKPVQVNLDMKAFKMLDLGGLNASITLWIYNVFDIRNELEVWSDTGRAGYTLERLRAAEVRGYNNLGDFFTRPEWYSSPRQVRLVFSVGF
jgi:outer membrane receptor protein involved in Fe transport